MNLNLKDIFVLNGRLTNRLIFALGIILILIAIIFDVSKTVPLILFSIGTSILASSIVTAINAQYLMHQTDIIQMAEHWGIAGIYAARAEINPETNSKLKNVKQLDICAMGLKGFRDAQGALIERRISEGMRLRVLTLSPESSILCEIDKMEGVVEGSTKATIESLIDWINHLKGKALMDGQVVIKTYDCYPYDFYFSMDGTIFTGPYQAKTSQQTITYKYSKNSMGATLFSDYFESIWRDSNEPK